MREIVEDGVTGFVVPPNDPVALRDRIVTLRDDPELRRRMGRRGTAEMTERFRWKDVARRCLDAYEHLPRAR
jgi:glycosyltransferase involved in cell wall biosynthesis